MADETPDLEGQIKRARKLRRTGYAIIGIATLYLIIPMLVGAISGAANGHLWDPYTGQHFSEQAGGEEVCYVDARRLLQEAGELSKLTRSWDEPVREWQAKCRKNHPDLYQLLMDTRTDLLKRGKEG